MLFNKEQHVLSIAQSLSKDELQRFEGLYTTNSGKERRISLDDNQLEYVNGGSKFELLPLSKTELCFAGFEDIRLSFTSDWQSFVISTCSVYPETYTKE